MIIPNIWKNKDCLKPPTRYIWMGGVHKWRYPNSWMVYFMERFGGNPIFRKPPYMVLKFYLLNMWDSLSFLTTDLFHCHRYLEYSSLAYGQPFSISFLRLCVWIAWPFRNRFCTGSNIPKVSWPMIYIHDLWLTTSSSGFLHSWVCKSHNIWAVETVGLFWLFNVFHDKKLSRSRKTWVMSHESQVTP